MQIINKIKSPFILLFMVLVNISAVFAQEDQDSVEYSTDTTTVVVKKKLSGPTLKGKVLDGITNKPMSGASISIPGFSATISDEKGNFSVSKPGYKATLSVSAPGYHTKLVPPKTDKGLVVRILPVTTPSLFQTVRLPLGEKSLSRTTSALSSIRTLGAWEANSETPGSYLQGRLSGINVIRSSGTSGISADLFLRGFNSLYATNKPLFVVDGMIYDINNYGTSIIGGHETNLLQHLDIRDIEEMTVIKDAAVAGIYGTRAANGVVFINTNHAKDVQTQIDFAAYGGINTAPRSFPLLNGEQHRTYLMDVLKSQGLPQTTISNQVFVNHQVANNPLFYAYNNNTDWQSKVLKNSIDHNYYLRVTGGDNIAKYMLSVGYLNESGITDTTNNIRYSTRFNADLNLTKRLTATTNLSLSYDLRNLKDQGIAPKTNPIFASLVRSPLTSTNAVSASGAFSPTLADADTLGVSNPMALLKLGNSQNKNYRFFGSTDFNYQLGKQFNLSTLIGLTYNKSQENYFIPRLGVANDTLSNGVIVDSRSGAQVTRFFSLQTDTRVSYATILKSKHHLQALAGIRFINNDSEQDYVQGFNTGTDELLSVGNTNAASRIVSGNIGKWRTLNTYLTGNYSYQDKYLLNASLAIDGSSRFGRSIKNAPSVFNNRLAVLPAIGFAWLISSEDFIKNKSAFDLLKLRFSYGLVGNDDIGNNEARQYYVSQNILGLQGLVRGNISDPYLQWEIVKKLNSGVDAALWNERISLSFDVWQNRTDKMITPQIIESPLAGIESYISNNASMKTNGLDLSVSGRILSGKFNWTTILNFSTYKNKITQLSSEAILEDYAGGTFITKVGQPANLFYGYRTEGVYKSTQEANEAGLTTRREASDEFIPFGGGDVRFANLNSDNIIDENDRTVIGDPNPDFYGSFANNFSFKRWSLQALFSFVSGNDIYNYTRYQLEAGSNYYNQTTALLNRWRGEGQSTNVPKATFGDPLGNSRFSDRWIEDGSYFRLRTLSLSYNVPLKGRFLRYFNIYGTGNNVFTLTRYLGFDPEFSASGSIYRQGVDITLEPQVRSIQLGIRLGL